MLHELAYRPLLDLARSADDNVGWTTTQLSGWTVRGLIHHLATDCQRLLVALHTPAVEAAIHHLDLRPTLATGRAELTDDERERLGGVAERYPLLG